MCILRACGDRIANHFFPLPTAEANKQQVNTFFVATRGCSLQKQLTYTTTKKGRVDPDEPASSLLMNVHDCKSDRKQISSQVHCCPPNPHLQQPEEIGATRNCSCDWLATCEWQHLHLSSIKFYSFACCQPGKRAVRLCKLQST